MSDDQIEPDDDLDQIAGKLTGLIRTVDAPTVARFSDAMQGFGFIPVEVDGAAEAIGRLGVKVQGSAPTGITGGA